LTISSENAVAEETANKGDNSATEDITQNSEYIRWYHRCLEYKKEQEE